MHHCQSHDFWCVRSWCSTLVIRVQELIIINNSTIHFFIIKTITCCVVCLFVCLFVYLFVFNKNNWSKALSIWHIHEVLGLTRMMAWYVLGNISEANALIHSITHTHTSPNLPPLFCSLSHTHSLTQHQIS